ncbi:hypothetical protein BJY04DRAFT_73404 [Aspergillus karnatakaensis]|uniref:uncharacterized protein n=1 Tax=Aspergillus karnatakaensis TaxID=1810916 RepID=UPI003CCD653D
MSHRSLGRGRVLKPHFDIRHPTLFGRMRTSRKRDDSVDMILSSNREERHTQNMSKGKARVME